MSVGDFEAGSLDYGFVCGWEGGGEGLGGLRGLGLFGAGCGSSKHCSTNVVFDYPFNMDCDQGATLVRRNQTAILVGS